ncbi:hypothetical protein [Eubacterium sp.]|uniref:hypothetical protein n=1 Tax=Eubacterium sp. TaxID=142586 RepID=UPI002FCAB2AC
MFWTAKRIESKNENTQISFPKDYEEKLKNEYGDYMKLPKWKIKLITTLYYLI